ncbi:MAG: OmpH family outer membrane protein [Proteobacteria bacterium]|nr:OmpH family outer membrane protein [Pseudomonadota bacterium]
MRLVISAALALGLAAPSLAAAQGAAAPNANALGGTAIPGLCMISTQVVAGNSKVGQAATARLQELQRQAQAEVNAEKTPLDAEIKALPGQKASMKPAEFQAKQQALSNRAQALQQKANVRSAQIEVAREKALGRISAEAQSVIAAVYKAHGCGLLVDRNSVLGGNMSNDLTPGVIQGLDAKISTMTFDLEPLPAPAAR